MQDVLCTSCSTVIHMDFVDNYIQKIFQKKGFYRKMENTINRLYKTLSIFGRVLHFKIKEWSK